jgi:hypothetical protein
MGFVVVHALRSRHLLGDPCPREPGREERVPCVDAQPERAAPVTALALVTSVLGHPGGPARDPWPAPGATPSGADTVARPRQALPPEALRPWR